MYASSTPAAAYANALPADGPPGEAGVGAGGYATARTRYTADHWVVGHAHSYLFETFADLGLLGVALSLALLLSWRIRSTGWTAA